LKPFHHPRYALFLDKLIATRKAAGLTQYEMADLMGYDQSIVAKTESGVRRIDVSEFCVMCGHLGVRPEALLKGLKD
jgi:transcriptional regulator with XRE-family HTH domain